MPINCISADVCNVQTACLLNVPRQLQCSLSPLPDCSLSSQSLADQDRSMHPPRRAAAVLPRPRYGSCKCGLAESPTPHS